MPESCLMFGYGTRSGRAAALVTAAVFSVAAVLAGTDQPARAQVSPAPVLSGLGVAISPLTNVRPLRADTTGYIKDPVAAAQLGKAFFWDIQAGSDGQACASCHFHAGVDIRTKNQVNPWLDEAAGNPDLIGLPGKTPQYGAFSPRQSDAGMPTGPNADLNAADFPFKRFADPTDRHSPVLYETNDRFSSSGSFGGDFSQAGSSAGPVDEKCAQGYDTKSSPFHKNGLVHRRVAARNAPSTINAIFNYRQFWDGRGNSEFNGVNPFGPRDADAKIWVDVGGAQTWRKVLIQNASAASQAVGPVLSSNEMSCVGRVFVDVARKLLPLAVLGQQKVHPSDSLFGMTAGLINTAALGLANTNYSDLIRRAFRDEYHRAGQAQLETNFALFWGLAIMEYEALLISDQSAFDLGNLNQQELDGQAIFTGKGKCVSCHSGPLLSSATVTSSDPGIPKIVDHMVMGDNTVAFYDRGFYNIGVRPAREDRGLGGEDPFGYDLSFARQYILRKWGLSSWDHFQVNPCDFKVPVDSRSCATEPSFIGFNANTLPRDAVDGAFKVPILRNVGLTPPYFHNGGQATLEQVVEFYNRGGDRQEFADGADSSGTMDLPVLSASGRGDRSNLDVNIGDPGNRTGGLGLSVAERASLVAFLKSLTDDRVSCHAGPFDHPELPLSVGHPSGIAGQANGARAVDLRVLFPATGKAGLSAEQDGSGLPLPCFPNSGSLFGQLQTVFAQIAPAIGASTSPGPPGPPNPTPPVPDPTPTPDPSTPPDPAATPRTTGGFGADSAGVAGNGNSASRSGPDGANEVNNSRRGNGAGPYSGTRPAAANSSAKAIGLAESERTASQAGGPNACIGTNVLGTGDLKADGTQARADATNISVNIACFTSTAPPASTLKCREVSEAESAIPGVGEQQLITKAFGANTISCELPAIANVSSAAPATDVQLELRAPR